MRKENYQELFKKNTSQFCYNTGDCGGSNYCAAQVNGRCFDNGKPMDMPCSGDNQCTLNSTVGKCVTGETALRFGIKKGECTENNAPCGEDDHSSKGNGRGLCYQFQCVYDYAGGPLDASNRLNEQSCRAYPESESPFGAQIVDDPAGAGYDTGGNAVKHKAGFQGANICVKGEICECKYQKVSYGRGGAITRYNSYDATAVDRICVGGDKEGQACSANADCNEPNPPNGVNVSGGEGTCERVSKRAFAYGWPGFCLDYDSSFNINGDQNQFACNLWLPVDQLQGAADLFNQHFEAGYISPVNQLMYCQASSGMPAAGLDAEGTHPGYRKRIYYEGTGTFLQGCVSSGYCAPKSESECDNSPNNQDPGFPYGGSLANPAMFGEGNVTGKSCKWNNISHICEDNVEIHPHTGGSNHTFTGATACKDFAMAPPACTGTSSGQCPSLQQPSLVGLDVGLFGEAVLKTSIAVWPCLYPYVGLLCPYIVTSSLCSTPNRFPTCTTTDPIFYAPALRLAWQFGSPFGWSTRPKPDGKKCPDLACSAAEAAAGGVNVWFDCTKAKREGFACSDAEKNIGGKYQWRTCGQMQCTAAEQQSQSDYPDSPVRYVQGSFYDPIPQDLDDHHLGAGLGQDVNQSDIAGLEFNVEGDSILKFYLTAENHWTNSWEWKGTSKISGP